MVNMKTAGIVAEFNPFHNGHSLLIQKTREAGYSHIAVVMSGNYTQRGEAACMLKEARVRAALACGADLVVELPLPWAVSSAEDFAFGAVSLFAALGCVDALSFGSECGDTAKLVECANALNSLDNSGVLTEQLSRGCSYPKACSLALGGEYENILSSANDTLAVEYIKAIKKLGAPIAPLAIKRIGAAHDSDAVSNGKIAVASAKKLRLLMEEKDFSSVKKFMPAPSAEIFENEIAENRAPFIKLKAQPLILSALRRMGPDDFARLPDVAEGLENRIFRAAQSACSLDELYRAIKSKRYTMARIKRIILCAYLGIESDIKTERPPYIHLLGFNTRGLDILRSAKKNSTLPIVSRHADFAQLDGASQRIHRLECMSTDLYCMCLPKILPCGLEQKFETVRLNY
jgi:predicted nucleotidyltransferase